ncbi:MAG TPA: LacI family transcriptional regulator [Spirochaeta sp.]|nr:LacI family transcriptional regulator [Spirochaeta sp.]
MQPTIKDIAKELDINFSSVSRALNNKPGVSEETRKLVIKTAAGMGYKPNSIARGLVNRSTKTIGVILPDIINPVFGAIATGIIDTANANDYDIFLCISNWSNKKERDYIHTIQQKQVDGLIIKTVDDSNQKLFKDIQVPVIGHESWSTNINYTSVSTDNEKGGYIAAKHLINCGYRKTGIIEGPIYASAGVYRRKGFIQGFRDSGLEFDENRIFSNKYDIESGYSLARELFNSYPDTDSIFNGNDFMALGTLKYLEENNLKPGKDVGVIGFDNIGMAGLPQIKLTTIKQPKYSIGRIMINVLLDEIAIKNQGNENFPQRIMLEPKLIHRGTTCRQKTA